MFHFGLKMFTLYTLLNLKKNGNIIHDTLQDPWNLLHITTKLTTRLSGFRHCRYVILSTWCSVTPFSIAMAWAVCKVLGGSKHLCCCGFFGLGVSNGSKPSSGNDTVVSIPHRNNLIMLCHAKTWFFCTLLTQQNGRLVQGRTDALHVVHTSTFNRPTVLMFLP